jgi:hypothetical protein
MNPSKKKRRDRLWHERAGMCHWCAVKTVLPPSGVMLRHHPDNLATIDHLDGRLSPDRGKHSGKERTVLACRRCNQQRGQEALAERHL